MFSYSGILYKSSIVTVYLMIQGVRMLHRPTDGVRESDRQVLYCKEHEIKSGVPIVLEAKKSDKVAAPTAMLASLSKSLRPQDARFFLSNNSGEDAEMRLDSLSIAFQGHIDHRRPTSFPIEHLKIQ